MNAPVNGNHYAPATFDNETSNISEVDPVTSTKTTGKLTKRISRNIVSRFPAKILGGLAVGALMAAAVMSPMSARQMLADGPANPLVRVEADRSNQLAEEMLEFGRVTDAKAVTPSYDRISEEMLEFGPSVNAKTVTPSYDRISEEMLEFGPVANGGTASHSHR